MLVLSLVWPYYGMRIQEVPWAETSFVIGLVAFLMAWLTKQPIWWRLIHSLFMPMVWAVSRLAIDPGWFLLAFILLLLIYRGALTGQIPLYLSNAATVSALERWASDRPALRFIDLGAGVGSILVPLARRFPGGGFVGVENAPLTWLAGRWRTRHQPNLEWRWGDLWAVDLKEFDVVYAFLSPAPMSDLWQKARAEMSPGSFLISNSFPVPEVEADQVIEVGCCPSRQLYCYQI